MKDNDDTDNILHLPVGNSEVPVSKWQVVSQALHDIHKILGTQHESIQALREIAQGQIILNNLLIERIQNLEENSNGTN